MRKYRKTGADMKICMPGYKLAYSILFMLALSVIRGVAVIAEIGGAIDSYAALLAVVFCAETYAMERSSGRWEVLSLTPLKKRTAMVFRRMGIQCAYLCILAYVGYAFFFWQPQIRRELLFPRDGLSGSLLFEYGLYVPAVTVTILFWGMLSMTLSTLCRSQWAGIGIAVLVWFIVNSKGGFDLLGDLHIFAYGSREFWQMKFGWLLGKGAGLLGAVAMALVFPWILKKRG